MRRSRRASQPHPTITVLWAVIGIYEGQESNTFYRRSGKRLEELNRREIRAGEAVLLGPEVIHAIENRFGSNTLGLHVYGGDVLAADRSMWHPSTREELPYDTRRMSKWCAELTKSRSSVQPAGERTGGKPAHHGRASVAAGRSTAGR